MRKGKYTKKPWGGFSQYAFNEQCTVKIIEVKKGETLSLQSHKNRDELWIALDEGLKIEIDCECCGSKPGGEYFIPKGSKHRLSSIDRDARLLEVSFGEFDEDDITRYEDKYGRTK